MQGEVSFQTDTFLVWLLHHKEYTPYIEFDSPNDPSDVETRRKELQKTIDQISKFYQLQILPGGPQIPDFPPVPPFLSAERRFQTHRHFFLQWKLFRLRCKSYSNAKIFVLELVEQLNALLASDFTQVVKINTKDLLIKLLEDPKKAQMIATKDSQVVNIISNHELATDSFENQKFFLHFCLSELRRSGSRSEVFQERFEELFFHPNFIRYQEIRSIVLPASMLNPEQFTLSIVAAMNNFISVFAITDPNDVSMFSLIFFRCIFDIAYIVNPDFFEQKGETCIRNAAHKITPDIASVNPSILPAGITIPEIVLNNEYLKHAADTISQLPFVCSPLDGLCLMQEALSDVRRYVDSVGEEFGDDAHSFDSIFGVFLVIVIGSDIHNIEEVFWFIISFSPSAGLSGPLEYARATATAVFIQLSKMNAEVNRIPN